MGTVTSITSARPGVLEFFAGIGLARLGLEQAGFNVIWSNDLEPAKHAMYRNARHEPHHYVVGDIADVRSDEVPAQADVAWASSPCTDLSLAGGRAGLGGKASGTFWEFIRILRELGPDRPAVAVLENVTGLATSRGGDDLAAAIRAFNELGYSVDALTLDARRFVPQSRPRLFLVATNSPIDRPDLDSTNLRPDWLQWVFADPTLVTHRAPLPEPPNLLTSGFSELAAKADRAAVWWTTDRVSAFVGSLSPIQRERIEALQAQRSRSHRTAYRRTRNGKPVWEIRADDISGCLRTARGGSSKQAVVRVGRGGIDVRWMTAFEYAYLMGAGDFPLTGLRDSQVLFGFGDAVAVPVVAWLGEHYLMRALKDWKSQRAEYGNRVAATI